MTLYCVECMTDIKPVKITGEKAYPHRKDLSSLVFWECPVCNNFVGTHKDSKKNAPLGIIANQELKNARKHIHVILDPLWKSGENTRKEIYKIISEALGYEYHTAKIRSIKEAREVYKIVFKLKKLIAGEEI